MKEDIQPTLPDSCNRPLAFYVNNSTIFIYFTTTRDFLLAVRKGKIRGSPTSLEKSLSPIRLFLQFSSTKCTNGTYVITCVVSSNKNVRNTVVPLLSTLCHAVYVLDRCVHTIHTLDRNELLNEERTCAIFTIWILASTKN